MTASTATTQPPDKCPACGAAIYNDDDVNGLRVVKYGCGRRQTQHPAKDYWMVYKTCPQAENAAIDLRAALDDQHAATDRMHNELTDIRAERNAALARLAELQAVCDAARHYVNATRIISKLEDLHECDEADWQQANNHYTAAYSELCITVDALTALASGAVVAESGWDKTDTDDIRNLF